MQSFSFSCEQQAAANTAATQQQLKQQKQQQAQKPTAQSTRCEVVDIGINVTSRELSNQWRDVVVRAEQAGVVHILLTGTSIRSSEDSLQIARRWHAETKKNTLFCTVGVHPHHAKSFDPKRTIRDMRRLLANDFAVAVGECGLDYNRMFSSRSDQMVRLKCLTGAICLQT